MTQLEMTTSTLSSGSGICSIQEITAKLGGKLVGRHAVTDELRGLRDGGQDDRAQLAQPGLSLSSLGGDVLVNRGESALGTRLGRG
jgi:hypothetical protein